MSEDRRRIEALLDGLRLLHDEWRGRVRLREEDVAELLGTSLPHVSALIETGRLEAIASEEGEKEIDLRAIAQLVRDRRPEDEWELRPWQNLPSGVREKIDPVIPLQKAAAMLGYKKPKGLTYCAARLSVPLEKTPDSGAAGIRASRLLMLWLWRIRWVATCLQRPGSRTSLTLLDLRKSMSNLASPERSITELESLGSPFRRRSRPSDGGR